MAESASPLCRVAVDGKFFRAGSQRFHPKGVTYGPLAPNRAGEPFPEIEPCRADLRQIRELGANLVRLYAVPPPWFLDLAAEHGIRLLIDVPWNQHACFLDRPRLQAVARQAVADAARACAGHPAVFALSLANEIPPDVVRWSGARRVEEFLDSLAGLVREIDPACLCTFGNFPPTEYLHPRALDFVCYNVYLHQPAAFRNYLARLQMQAEDRPLLLGELGIDSRREGEERQAALLAGHLESAFRGGAAGAVVFGFTDEWFRNGRAVEDWFFGLTDRDRRPKPAFAAVREAWSKAPHSPRSRRPRVSVVVACYNGARTIPACLESLGRLNYPDYEVIVVDDGSTDDTPGIVERAPGVRSVRHERNLGLSVARNTGIAAASGEIIAFTDADCRADEDWLHYLVGDLADGAFVGVGGPNFMPPEDTDVAAVVLASPGGPTHVMLTDRVAEHLPGCNMAFWRWALDDVGGFDPVFRRAGDDVDLCWRLQERGHQIGFSPAAFVWHHRRSTVGDYLRQQQGYGEAEAMLLRKHPERFNLLGASLWKGRIYGAGSWGFLTRGPMIYRGSFATGLFQTLYTAPPAPALALVTSLECHVLVTLPLALFSAVVPGLLFLAAAMLLLSLGACIAAAVRAPLPPRKTRPWSRPLVALLHGLQPIVRGWARYRGRLLAHRAPLAAHETLASLSREQRDEAPDEVRYVARPGFDRTRFLMQAFERLELAGWEVRVDAGWRDYDLEVLGGRWVKLQLRTVSEYAPDGHQVLRCGLEPALTMPAQLALCGLLVALLLVTGLWGQGPGWLWLVWLALPALTVWLNRQQRAQQRLIALLLDNLADELGLLLARASADEPQNRDGSII
ncbi:MAG TPA: glycosyltransferase [Verrucomicrobiota bacterium]|nr:glycosyltransferase [Verrucomicrobiota bacterium]HNU50972.1 glycosyltransferase [Verrucomicrobiota bacterium]